MKPSRLLLLCVVAASLGAPGLKAAAQGSSDASAAPPERPTASEAAPIQEAWGELAAGRLRPAEQAFLRLAAGAPAETAGPLLGAGIAAAAAGDVDGAARRLRAVLGRGGALGVLEMPASAALAALVRQGRSNLEEGLLDARDPGAVLLSAALLDYLIGEDATARLSLDAAIRRDGLLPAMQLLDERLQDARLGRDRGVPVSPLRNLDAVLAAEAAEAAEAAQAPPTRAAPAASEPVASEPESPASPTPPVPSDSAEPDESPIAPRVFLDYEKLNRRVGEMAGSLESFEQKLLGSLMRPPAQRSPSEAAPAEAAQPETPPAEAAPAEPAPEASEPAAP